MFWLQAQPATKFFCLYIENGPFCYDSEGCPVVLVASKAKPARHFFWLDKVTRARWKVLGLRIKTAVFGYEMSYFFNMVPYDLNTLGPVLLQQKLSFPGLRIRKAVKTVIYGRCDVFVGPKSLSSYKFHQLWGHVEDWRGLVGRVRRAGKILNPKSRSYRICNAR